ncbi:membralin isoform X1, partial [Brachionus plicatilis]
MNQNGAQTSGPDQANTRLNANIAINQLNQNAIFQPVGQQQQSIVHVRDRLFHALFYRIAILYARKFSKTFRRVIEFFLLLLAFASFALLSYLHIVFNRNPINCLSTIQQNWPRDGILRVEIVHNASKFFLMSSQDQTRESYSLKDSYEKEYSTPMKELFFPAKDNALNKDKAARESYFLNKLELNQTCLMQNPFIQVCAMGANHSSHEKAGSNDEVSKGGSVPFFDTDLNQKEIPKSTVETMSPTYRFLKDAISELQLFNKVFEDNYIIEYSLEYGFLRLSPATRQKLNISVMLVTLDPNRDECFGSGFNKFVLDE